MIFTLKWILNNKKNVSKWFWTFNQGWKSPFPSAFSNWSRSLDCEPAHSISIFTTNFLADLVTDFKAPTLNNRMIRPFPTKYKNSNFAEEKKNTKSKVQWHLINKSHGSHSSNRDISIFSTLYPSGYAYKVKDK